MKYLIGLLFIFFNVIVQQTIIPNNFYLLIIFLILLSSEDKKSIIFLFIAGLIIDLTCGTSLGRNSLGLLAGWGLIYLYRRRFSFDNAIVSSVFFYLFFFCSLVIGNKPWYGSELVIYGFLVLTLAVVAPWLLKTKQGKFQL